MTHVRLSRRHVARLLAGETVSMPFGIELSYRDERAYVVSKSQLERWTELPDNSEEMFLIAAVMDDVVSDG